MTKKYVKSREAQEMLTGMYSNFIDGLEDSNDPNCIAGLNIGLAAANLRAQIAILDELILIRETLEKSDKQ